MRPTYRFDTRLFHGSLALLAVLSVPALAQEASELVVESDPEVRIELDGIVRLMPDGSVRAPTSQQPADFCPESCEGVQVDLESFTIEGEPATIQISQGDTVEVDWESLGARNCVAGGDLPDWTDVAARPIAGPANLTVDGERAEGTYTVALTCSNGSVDSETLSVQVEVEEFLVDPGVPEHCDASRRLPSTWTRRIQCEYDYGWKSDCRTFQGVWSQPFLEQSGNGANLGVANSQEYISMAFTTDGLDPSDVGKIDMTATDGTATIMSTRSKFITISSCPADFNFDAVQEETGCFWPISSAGLSWGGVNTSRFCKLEADKTYFLNIVFTESPYGTAPSLIEPHPDCDETVCGDRYRPAN